MGKADDGDDGQYSGDENKERGNWSGKLDFLLSAIGFAVGLGNVWRFPYKAYENGGASFLIPYVIMLLCAGLPMFFMEMGMGQFASLGPISVWKAVPFFRGIGWSMVIISALVCIYYNMIIAYTLFYFFASLNKEVPWKTCKPEWITENNCVDRANMNETERNATDMLCKTMRDLNLTDTPEYAGNCSFKTPSAVYWEREVLDMSPGIDQGHGEIRWQLALCLLLAWIIIFLCLSKGIKSSGKVVYVTATFPYIVLIILLVRNATLEGAIEGIKYYVIPDWNKLTTAKVWHEAAVQIFYSLGVAFGGLETMASYNRFNNNVYRDSVIVAILNCATSVFAGFVIFSVIGFMAVSTGQPVDQVAEYGPGLAFIAYPMGIAMMPVSPLWSVLFFLMLFTLGLDSQFAMMETIISSFVDEFAWFKKGRRKILFTAALCIGFFFLGLPQCSRAGIFVMTLFDWYSASFSLMIVAFCEVIALAWIYNFKRFSSDIEMMIGHKPNVYWLATWIVITPALMIFIIAFAATQHTNVTYNAITYPAYADYVGWGMVALALGFIPLMAVVETIKARSIVRVFKPYDDWGPALPRHRTGIYADGIGLSPVDDDFGHTNKGFDSPNYM